MNVDTWLEPRAPGTASKEMLAMMRSIDSREWWLWVSNIAVTILLAFGILSFALPSSFPLSGSFSAFFQSHAARGLFGFVLLFNIYVLYEQTQIHRIRHEMADQLYRLTVLDPLTGLFNRRYVEHRLEEEMSRSQRHGSPLTVILFDLDAFKEINDEHGHGVGDEVLKSFADRLKSATRGSDVAARYGGDEFLVVLPDCKPGGVQYVLQRLTGIHVEAEPPKRLPVSCSAGWADYTPGETMTAVLKRADLVLYKNKRSTMGLSGARPASTS